MTQVHRLSPLLTCLKNRLACEGCGLELLKDGGTSKLYDVLFELYSRSKFSLQAKHVQGSKDKPGRAGAEGIEGQNAVFPLFFLILTLFIRSVTVVVSLSVTVKV